MAVAEAPSNIVGMSLEEFMRLFDEEGPFELIDGERVAYMPTKMFGNFRLANRLMFAMNSIVIPKGIGEAFVEGTFIMPSSDSLNWVKGSRIPDVMYIQSKKLELYRQTHSDWEVAPLALIPDFVIEIISENDNYADVIKKVANYLADGVKQVWLMEPQTRITTIYLDNMKHQTTYSFDDAIVIGELIPDLQIRVSDLLQ